MDLHIAHTVAYLLRCHGTMGDNDNDNGDGVTGNKVDDDCVSATDDQADDDDE